VKHQYRPRLADSLLRFVKPSRNGALVGMEYMDKIKQFAQEEAAEKSKAAAAKTTTAKK
jgi:hypothetical protein